MKNKFAILLCLALFVFSFGACGHSDKKTNVNENVSSFYYVNDEEESKGEKLVFEAPLEIKEEKVMFKAESDQFVDKDKAMEVFEPVAEIINKNPYSQILIAGTTDSEGNQEESVLLSNKRANAVKNLLVELGVNEAQLITIGLGFEVDPFERGEGRMLEGCFVESEGAKNNRVFIMDVKDPIAQQILDLGQEFEEKEIIPENSESEATVDEGAVVGE